MLVRELKKPTVFCFPETKTRVSHRLLLKCAVDSCEHCIKLSKMLPKEDLGKVCIRDRLDQIGSVFKHIIGTSPSFTLSVL
jgi:hypothetical protein